MIYARIQKVNGYGRFKLVVLAFILLFQLAGCITIKTPSYPNTWPELSKFDSIQNFSGDYPARLWEILRCGKPDYTPGKCNTKIRVVGYNEIKVALNCKNKDTIPDSLIWCSETHYSVDVNKDRMRVVFENETHGGDPIFGIKNDFIEIYPTKNGSCIYKEGWQAIGLIFMLFPCYFNEHSWNMITETGQQLKLEK